MKLVGIFASLLVLQGLVSSSAYAEASLSLTLSMQMLPYQPSVANGVNSDKGPAAVFLRASRKVSPGVTEFGNCTIVPIGKRIFVSDAHCFDSKFKVQEIYLAAKPDLKKPGIPLEEEVITKSEPHKDMTNDLAIGMIPTEFVFPDYTPISEIATESEVAEILKTGGKVKANVYGYGIYQSVEMPDGTFVQIGVGTRRMGSVALTGMGKTDPRDGIVDDKDGPFIVAVPNPNSVAPGDSGGPLVYQKKILALATAFKKLLPEDGNETASDKSRLAEKLNVAWVDKMIFLPLYKHKAWIEEKAKIFQDKQDKAIQKLLETSIGGFYDFTKGITAAKFNEKVAADFSAYDKLRAALAAHLGVAKTDAPLASGEAEPETPNILTLHLFDEKSKPTGKLVVTKNDDGGLTVGKLVPPPSK